MLHYPRRHSFGEQDKSVPRPRHPKAKSCLWPVPRPRSSVLFPWEKRPRPRPVRVRSASASLHFVIRPASGPRPVRVRCRFPLWAALGLGRRGGGRDEMHGWPPGQLGVDGCSSFSPRSLSSPSRCHCAQLAGRGGTVGRGIWENRKNCAQWVEEVVRWANIVPKMEG
eukprot:gene24416-biopygen23896